MLEKMGWSKGKGLGAKEDGAQDHLRIKNRIGNEGLGWIERDNNPELSLNYEQALANLNKHHASTAASNGVTVKTENKSERTSNEPVKRMLKIRHRYGKVLRAKDTSSYSQEDMAKIFAVKVDDYLTSDATSRPDSSGHPHVLDPRDSHCQQVVANPVIPESRGGNQLVHVKVEAVDDCSQEQDVQSKSITRKDKKNKKRQRKDVDRVTDGFNQMSDCGNRHEVDRENRAKRQKKKKRKKDTTHRDERQSVDEEATITIKVEHEYDAVPETNDRKRKKKKRQQESQEQGQTSGSESGGRCEKASD